MKILVVGGSGGIGRQFVETLSARPGVEHVHATFNRTPPAFQSPRVSWHRLDVTDEAAIAALAAALGELDWLINAVGLLHDATQGPEKTIRRLDADFFLHNISINTLPTLLLAKHFAAALRHDRPAVFAAISARVGSIEENGLGGWYSYRASKAALNMGLKTLSIEWRRTHRNVAVAALHPGTTDTALSRPFQRNVPAGSLFSTARTVNYLLAVLDNLGAGDSGQFWSFDGEILPW